MGRDGAPAPHDGLALVISAKSQRDEANDADDNDEDRRPAQTRAPPRVDVDEHAQGTPRARCGPSASSDDRANIVSGPTTPSAAIPKRCCKARTRASTARSKLTGVLAADGPPSAGSRASSQRMPSPASPRASFPGMLASTRKTA